MKNSFAIIVVLTAFGFLSLFVYRLLTLREAEKPNGFCRKYPLKQLALKSQIALSGHWNRIVVSHDGKIWVAGSKPGLFLVSDSDLRQSSIIEFDFGNAIINKINSVFSASVDSSSIYVFASNIPAILTYHRHLRRATLTELTPGVFSQAVAIDSGDIALRKYVKAAQDQGFFKLSTHEDKLRFYGHIVPVNHDGGLSADGQLLWDRLTARLLYVSFYSNTWFCANKDFSALGFHYTIDSFHNARVSMVRQGTYMTSKGSAKPLNAYSSVNSGRLYIHSSLRSDKEKPEQFDKYFPIDVYDIISGKYQETLALPKLNTALRSFIIIGHRIYAQYQDKIASFEIPN